MIKKRKLVLRRRLWIRLLLCKDSRVQCRNCCRILSQVISLITMMEEVMEMSMSRGSLRGKSL